MSTQITERLAEQGKGMLLRPFGRLFSRLPGGAWTALLVFAGQTIASLVASPLGQWFLVLPLLWLCVGTCWLYREIHQEKKKIIEGMLQREKATWLSAEQGLTGGVQWLAHLFLLVAIVLGLRLLAGAWGTALFKPAPTSLAAWGWYGLDLFCKAALFDIPEVFQINLIQIKHVGWFGGTVVLAVRMLILVLLVSAVMRWRDLYQLVERSVSMAQHSPALSRQRLALILSLYPGQAKRLSRWAHHQKWRDKPKSRCAMLEMLGHHKAPFVKEALIEAHWSVEPEPIRVAALRGMATLGDGPLSSLEALLMSPSDISLTLRQQICQTLAAWGHRESLDVLQRAAFSHKSSDVRMVAIQALGDAGTTDALPGLIEIMYSGKRAKQERFAAKDAILAVGVLPGRELSEVQHQLVHSPYADNRRFSGMLLEGIQQEGSFALLGSRLQREDDPHALIYIIQGLTRAIEKVYDAEHANDFQLVQELALLCQESAELGIYRQLKRIISSEDGGAIVARIAAIEALADFAGVWALCAGPAEELPSVSDVLTLLQELLRHPDPQIADVARDTRSRFPRDLLSQCSHTASDSGVSFSGEGSEGYRRDMLTCAGVSFHIKDLKAARPAMPLQEPGLRPELGRAGAEDVSSGGVGKLDGVVPPVFAPPANASHHAPLYEEELDAYRRDEATCIGLRFHQRESKADRVVRLPPVPSGLARVESDDVLRPSGGDELDRDIPLGFRLPGASPEMDEWEEEEDWLYSGPIVAGDLEAHGADEIDSADWCTMIAPTPKLPTRPLGPQGGRSRGPVDDALWDGLPQWMRSRYRWVKTVSQGALATVYQVYDRVWGKALALKVANNTEKAVGHAVWREIEALQACKGVGVLPIVDAYPRLTTPAFTVPWIDQVTLFRAMARRSKQGEPWRPEEVEEIMVGLSHILQEVHKRGWCHGDLKPENIFYADGKVILYDMGASREIGDGFKDTLTLSVGTPYYMAPEQVHRKAIDKRVDIYAMGILAYELLAGVLPLGMAPPAVGQLREDVASSIDDVLQRATAYDPNERFDTPEAFRLALLSALYPTESDASDVATDHDASEAMEAAASDAHLSV